MCLIHLWMYSAMLPMSLQNEIIRKINSLTIKCITFSFSIWPVKNTGQCQAFCSSLRPNRKFRSPKEPNMSTNISTRVLIWRFLHFFLKDNCIHTLDKFTQYRDLWSCTCSQIQEEAAWETFGVNITN